MCPCRHNDGERSRGNLLIRSVAIDPGARPDCTPATARSAAKTSAGSACTSAARVSALAGPNVVLVSSTLRALVIGSGLEFEERGANQFEGVPGEWRLFAVAST
jgi:hypothetical protein